MANKKITKAEFSLKVDEKGDVSIAIVGKRFDLLELISYVAHQDKNILDILADSVLAAIAIHMKEEHGIDILEYMEAKMDQQFSQYKKKERVVN